MTKVVRYGGALAFALLLAFGGSIGWGLQAVAYAQDVTPVPTVGTTQTQVQPAQPAEDDNETPWGLLGLLGLAGLAGLRRQPERQVAVRHETERVAPGVGVYDSKK